jgi:hypothetical protein
MARVESSPAYHPKSAMGFWTAQSCGVDSGFQPRFVSHVGAVALPGHPIAILSIVFGIGEAFLARLPHQRLL